VIRAAALLAGLVALVLGACGHSRPPNADQDAVTDAIDCAPTDATKWQLMAYQSADVDGDDHRSGPPGQVCSGAALPARYSAAPADAGDVDCNDANPAIWRLLPFQSADADGDGHRRGPGTVCAGALLPATHSNLTAAAGDIDCDDASATTWRLTSVYRDADGDGLGAGKGTITCIGTNAAAGYSLRGYDPLDDPTNPASSSVSDLDLPAWLRQPADDAGT
jgi:hypothetical protein